MRFKYQTCANQQIDIAEDCPDVELNKQSLKIVENMVILVTQQELQQDIVITGIRNRWSKFRDMVLFLTKGDFPIAANGRLYSACACSFMLYGSET